jgi:hypothetical protein
MPGASLGMVERVCKMKANISSPVNKILSPPPSVRGSARLSMRKQSQQEHGAQHTFEERRAPHCDALYSDGIVGHRSCDRITFDPSAAAPSK